jgi:hypothetical protein
MTIAWGTVRDYSGRPFATESVTTCRNSELPKIANAAASVAGIRPAISAAGAAAGRWAAGRCARAHRSCCSGLRARHRRAASARGPRNRD